MNKNTFENDCLSKPFTEQSFKNKNRNNHDKYKKVKMGYNVFIVLNVWFSDVGTVKY